MKDTVTCSADTWVESVIAGGDVEIWANRIPLETLYPDEYLEAIEAGWEWPDISGRITINGVQTDGLVVAADVYCEGF